MSRPSPERALPRHFEIRRHFSLEAAAQANETARVLGQERLVDARTIVEAFGVARRHELDQVVVALHRLRQQHQMIGGLTDRPTLVQPAARRDIDLTAQDGFDAALPGMVMEND